MSNMSPNNLLQEPDNRVPAAPMFHHNRYFETREPWTVSYEGGGIQAHGRVLGFSEAGWHIVGEAPVKLGMRLTLRVHLPDRFAVFCVPSATVQWMHGRAFVIRVELQGGSSTPAES